MRLRIVTTPREGADALGPLTGKHVRVVDADTGRALDGVASVTWHCAGRGQPAIAVLVVHGVDLDVLADLPPEMVAAMRLVRGDDGA